MESANLSKNELIDLIIYGLKENNIDGNDINFQEIESIISNYIKYCNHFKNEYVRGELDTFKRAACLLVAINRGMLSKDKRSNASIALDAAYKMCEKPYWNVGKKFNIPKKLEEVEFKKVFENDMYAYNKSKDMLIASLVFENASPITYYLSLELFYQAALELKHNNDKLVDSETQEKISEEESPNLEVDKSPKQGKRILSLFKRIF